MPLYLSCDNFDCHNMQTPWKDENDNEENPEMYIYSIKNPKGSKVEWTLCEDCAEQLARYPEVPLEWEDSDNEGESQSK